MNRLFLVFGVLFILIIPQAAQAATTTQYPNPYRQTAWNNFTDGLHTLGQNPQQAKWTKTKLHNARTRARQRSISKANQAKFRAKRQAWLNSQNNSQ